MDYEKMYKEALKRVRRLHDRMQVLSSTDALVASSELEFIFPELAENEDERIRKEIVGVIQKHYPNTPESYRWIAYLEKQKEQKPVSISCGHENDAEWNEEDKRKLNRIYEILGQAADEKPFGSSKRIIGDKEAVELQDFIKLLRPSWKPSDGQMDALQNAVALTACDKELAKLYNQLKKL